METKVTLVEWPRWPIETVYYLWQVSRHNDPVLEPGQIYLKSANDPDYKKEVRKVFEQIIDSPYPIAENLWFVFLLENVSISFREQMVRHRIGVKVGERVGVDMFPDLHDSTWWSQSMRYSNMGEFANKESYRMPESIDTEAKRLLYVNAMQVAQRTYNDLVKQGVPLEDAREVIPLGTTHRVSWGINLHSLAHIMKKRSCWILQLGVWGPVIRGMINELATRVDPYFANLVTPPCIKGNEFKECVALLDNQERTEGKDPLPPCSLFLYNHPHLVRPNCMEGKAEKFNKMREDYKNFWRRNPETGVRF